MYSCIMKQPIILASKSPRRKYLLELAEIPFEIITQDTPEDFPADMPIADVPVHIARQKALAIHALHPQRTILAADTIVVLNDRIIGKPKDAADAENILSLLSDQVHRVITGVVILHGDQEVAFSDTTEVSFHALSHDQIQYYVSHYKPFDKAGAYAIQEWIGAIAIRRIDGCFYNVMGLPISRVAAALQNVESPFS